MYQSQIAFCFKENINRVILKRELFWENSNRNKQDMVLKNICSIVKFPTLSKIHLEQPFLTFRTFDFFHNGTAVLEKNSVQLFTVIAVFNVICLVHPKFTLSGSTASPRLPPGPADGSLWLPSAPWTRRPLRALRARGNRRQHPAFPRASPARESFRTSLGEMPRIHRLFDPHTLNIAMLIKWGSQRIFVLICSHVLS